LQKSTEADKAEWQKRGVFGRYLGAESATKEITISVKQGRGTKQMANYRFGRS